MESVVACIANCDFDPWLQNEFEPGTNNVVYSNTLLFSGHFPVQ